MDEEEWISKIVLSSIPLIERRGTNPYPIGAASGCLIDYFGRRFILSVFHATHNGGDWSVEMRFIPGSGVELYPLGTMNFLQRGELNIIGIKSVDFSYKEVPLDLTPLWQEIGPDGITNQIPKIVCQVDFNFVPDDSKRYGFFGKVPVRRENWIWVTNPVLEKDLIYVRSEADYHIFKLSHKHPGHKYFKGCSGAPIIDNNGKTVALVCGGKVKDNTIYGISLSRYKAAFDIETGLLG